MSRPQKHTLIASAFIALTVLNAAASATDQPSNSANTNEKQISTITANRASYQHQLNDLFLLFPEDLNSTSQCYQSAFSNYVEDQWNLIAAKTIVPHRNEKKLAPDELILSEDTEESRSAFAASAPFYSQMRQIVNFLEMENPALTKEHPQTVTPTDGQNQTQKLQSYVDECSHLKPLPWSVIGTEIDPKSRITATTIKLTGYNTLIQAYVTHHLPSDKKGLIRCVNSLDSIEQIEYSREMCGNSNKDYQTCIESRASDTKDNLLAKLKELQAHDCSLGYAYKMVVREKTKTQQGR